MCVPQQDKQFATKSFIIKSSGSCRFSPCKFRYLSSSLQNLEHFCQSQHLLHLPAYVDIPKTLARFKTVFC